MASATKARRALARGATDEALIHLWNEIEPARLEGDTRTLREIAALAAQVKEQGDPAYQREAERMLESLGGWTSAESPAVQTGAAAEIEPAPQDTTKEAEVEVTSRLGRIGGLVWIVLFLLIVIANAIRGQ
jgi:hypothetical protein